MKSKISSRPRILLVVRAILVHNNKLLLIQRSRNDSHDRLLWEIPGGKLDKGQDLNGAIERELIEEVGILAIPIKKLVFFDSDIDSNSKYKGIPYIRMTGLYKAETNNVKLSSEHEEYKWVSFDKALSMNITDFTRKSLLAWEEELLKLIKYGSK